MVYFLRPLIKLSWNIYSEEILINQVHEVSSKQFLFFLAFISNRF